MSKKNQDKRQASKEDAMLLRKALLKRGWTKTLIRDFLGAPDMTQPNPDFPSASPLQLFSVSRVHHAEAQPAFKARKKLLQKRPYQGDVEAVCAKGNNRFSVEEALAKSANGEMLKTPQIVRRGWTRCMIRDLLGAPDAHVPNTHFHASSPVRLYMTERVVDVEQTDAYRQRASRRVVGIQNRSRKTQYMSTSQLERCGWTRAMVHKHLGEPDDMVENTWFPGRPPIGVFAISRIKDAEATPAVRERLRTRRQAMSVKSAAASNDASKAGSDGVNTPDHSGIDVSDKKSEYLSQRQIEKRGWTRTMVREHLGAPDTVIENPYFKKGPLMAVFAMSRIESLEATPNVRDRLLARREVASVFDVAQTARQSVDAGKQDKDALPAKTTQEASQKTDTRFLSQRQIEKRGWTRKMVREHLGDPDTAIDNPHFKNMPPISVYALSRIESAEATQAVREKLLARKKAAGAVSKSGVDGKAESDHADKPAAAAATDKPECLSRNQVEKRGWTRAMIEKYLGAPDTEIDNPYFKNVKPIPVYILSRVKSAEAISEVREKLLARHKSVSAPFAKRTVKPAVSKSSSKSGGAQDKLDRAKVSAENTDHAKTESLSQSQLEKRGWTRAMIRAHLGAPDAMIDNPYFKNRKSISVFYLARVQSAEATQAVREKLLARNKDVFALSAKHTAKTAPAPSESSSKSDIDAQGKPDRAKVSALDANDEKIESLTQGQLKKRGWTRAMIQKYLCAPDAVIDNPYFKNGQPIPVYALSRIKSAEATQEVREKLLARNKDVFTASENQAPVLASPKPTSRSASKAVSKPASKPASQTEDAAKASPDDAEISVSDTAKDSAKTMDALKTSEIIERGWTRAMIEAYLGKPDELRPNKVFKNSPPLKYYLRSRIEAAEQQVTFRTRMQAREAKLGRALPALHEHQNAKLYTDAFRVNGAVDLESLDDEDDDLLDEPYISAAKVESRGWTRAMIRDLLGAPDRRVENPTFKNAPMMRLYALKRVTAIEESEAFNQRKYPPKQDDVAKPVRARNPAEIWAQKTPIDVDFPETLDEMIMSGCEYWEMKEWDKGNFYADSTEQPDVNQYAYGVDWLLEKRTTYDKKRLAAFGNQQRDAQKIIRLRVIQMIKSLGLGS